ncbi:MAG: Dabb family protein [candidate division KSB1 bacterium]|nr:Dabb family protein [candidate division KSB1 bacterium]MDZ7341532.1 Dabb family protein [candidate division KSB1 bacterium]
MVKHIVMWKLHEKADGRSRETNARLMKQWLEELRTKIPAIQYLEVGLNIAADEDAADVVLYSEFADHAALQHYQQHPDHIKFKERIQHIRLDKRVVDYLI